MSNRFSLATKRFTEPFLPNQRFGATYLKKARRAKKLQVCKDLEFFNKQIISLRTVELYELS